MCKSPNKTYNASSTLPASVQLSRIGRPYSPFPTAPPAPISPPSARHSPQHAISWRCTGAGSMIPKYNANCSASTNDCWLSPHNWIESRPPKNEEILAGQVAHPTRIIQCGMSLHETAEEDVKVGLAAPKGHAAYEFIERVLKSQQYRRINRVQKVGGTEPTVQAGWRRGSAVR